MGEETLVPAPADEVLLASGLIAVKKAHAAAHPG